VKADKGKISTDNEKYNEIKGETLAILHCIITYRIVYTWS